MHFLFPKILNFLILKNNIFNLINYSIYFTKIVFKYKKYINENNVLNITCIFN